MKLEQAAIDLLKKQGLSKHKPDDAYDPKELAMGMKVEKEHAKSAEIAKEIAKDHLEEVPDYYTRLAKMEKEAEKEKKEESIKLSSFLKSIRENGGEASGGETPSRNDIIKFLKKNTSPTDDEFHDWAEGMGFNVHKAEAAVYKLAAEHAKMVD